MKCTHCGGNIIGDQCLQCARFVNQQTIPVKFKMPKLPQKRVSKLGVCRCCGHEKNLWSDNLCGVCISYVNGIKGKYCPVGSKEREAVLKRVAAFKAKRTRRTLKEYRKESMVNCG
jgi:hypothetical protein